MITESDLLGSVTYLNPLKTDCPIEIPIPLPEYVEIDEYVGRAGSSGVLYVASEDDVRRDMLNVTLAERVRLEDEQADRLILDAISTDSFDLSKFNRSSEKQKSDPDMRHSGFADRFYHIMHNSSSQHLMLLVHKEVTMENEMSRLMRARAWEVDQLTKECEAMLGQAQDTSADIHPHQLSKLNEKLRQVHGSYTCQIEALAEEQRKQYRSMVDAIYSGDVSSLLEETSSDDVPQPHATKHHEETPTVDESFTIYIGAQLKSMHNARILSSPSLVDICRPKQDHDMGARLHMAMSLYGRSLTGIVMLVPKDPMWHTTSRSEFAKICEQSTELHFDSLADQLKEVAQSTRSANIWRASRQNVSANTSESEPLPTTHPDSSLRADNSLSVGDVYCTTHSNLRQAQAVFHLVVDEQLQTSDISSRHPCLNGIRNIVRLTARLGITSLYIPLMFIESSSESTTVAWCIRRAEMVYKCIKGYLMEVCASACGGSASSVPHYNIHFVLPSGLAPSIYQQITAMLPTIFHLVPGVSVVNSSSD